MHQMVNLVVINYEDGRFQVTPALKEVEGLTIDPVKGLWLYEGYPHLIGRARASWDLKTGLVGVFDKTSEGYTDERKHLDSIRYHLSIRAKR